MKTLAKAAIIILASVFGVLSCTADAELTAPNFSEYNKQYAANTLGGISSYPAPEIKTDTLDYDSSLPEGREVELSFPKAADFLRDNVTVSSLNFLTFNAYTSVDEGEDDYGLTPSAIISPAIPFSVVRMTGGDGDTVTITVRLNDILDYENIVAKIDCAKYKYAGGKLPGDGEWKGETGKAPYDDIYKQISTGNSDPFQKNGGFVSPGGPGQGKDWELILSYFDISGSNNNTDTGITNGDKTITVAVLSGSGTDYQDTIDSVMTKILGKLKLEKYDTAARQWADVKGDFTIEEVASGITNVKTNFIQLKFIAEEGSPYRVKATDVKELNVGEYYGAAQRVKVSSGVAFSPSYYYETVYSGISTWNKGLPDNTSLNHDLGTINKIIDGLYVETDIYGKNVKAHLEVTPIEKSVTVDLVTTSGNVWLKSGKPNLAAFKNNFKIVHMVANNGIDQNISGLNALSPTTGNAPLIRFIDIKAAEYASSGNNGDDYDEIVLTLDENYRYNPSGRKSLLIAPGFDGYDDSSVRFGNYGNLVPIDGTYFLGLYNYGGNSLSF